MISIPDKFVTRVNFDEFWEHIAGGPDTGAITKDTLQEVKYALLDQGVPSFTVHAYFLALFWKTQTDGQTLILEGILGELEALENRTTRTLTYLPGTA